MKLKRFNSFITESKMSRELEPIEGEKFDKFPFELNNLGDLIFPHGGLVEALAESNGEFFIIRWIDMDKRDYNRYMLYQIDKSLIRPFLLGRYSERSLLEKSNAIWIFDNDGENDINITKVKFGSIPEKYISDKEFKIKFGTKFANDLVEEYGWYPIGSDTSPGWYFKDAIGEKETKVMKFKDNLLDENGEPNQAVIDFYDGRLYKK